MARGDSSKAVSSAWEKHSMKQERISNFEQAKPDPIYEQSWAWKPKEIHFNDGPILVIENN